MWRHKNLFVKSVHGAQRRISRLSFASISLSTLFLNRSLSTLIASSSQIINIVFLCSPQPVVVHCPWFATGISWFRLDQSQTSMSVGRTSIFVLLFLTRSQVICQELTHALKRFSGQCRLAVCRYKEMGLIKPVRIPPFIYLCVPPQGMICIPNMVYTPPRLSQAKSPIGIHMNPVKDHYSRRCHA